MVSLNSYCLIKDSSTYITHVYAHAPTCKHTQGHIPYTHARMHARTNARTNARSHARTHTFMVDVVVFQHVQLRGARMAGHLLKTVNANAEVDGLAATVEVCGFLSYFLHGLVIVLSSTEAIPVLNL